MAIFSRRVIQHWLQENHANVGATVSNDHVQRLNHIQKPKEVVGAVWEVAVIWALRQFGDVTYEGGSGTGPRRPDLHFKSAESDLEFLVDITAVSDEGLHEINWVTDLRLELLRIQLKYGIGHLGLRTDFGRIKEGEYGDAVVRVAIPSKKDRSRLMKEEFEPLVKAIAQDPGSARTLRIQAAGVDIQVTYDPGNPGSGGASFPGYTTPYSLTNNPLFKALSKKRRQLKDSGYDGLRGIIVCDGGCGILRHTGYQGPEAYRLDQIINRFLSSTSSVQFVLAIGHELDMGGWSLQRTHTLIPHLFLGSSLRGREPEFRFLLDLVRVLPSPVETVGNAFRKHISGREPSKLSGEFRMSGTTIAIDAGDLIGLLSGSLKQEDWMEERVYTPEVLPLDRIPTRLSDVAGFFRLREAEGRRIVSMRILPRENNDHDLIEFEFGEVDPALGQFQMPITSE